MKLGKYIKWLKKLVEREREAEIEIMKKEIKTFSGKEREKLGRAILGLKGKVVGREFSFKIVKYGREKEIETEISVGDLVLISRRNPLKSNLVGVVTEKGKKYLCVALEKTPFWAFKNVRIDLFANDITFRRQIENLENITECGRLALKYALGGEKPLISQKVDFSPIDKNLNESQKLAVSFSLGTKDFFLIQGPFGTGKTRTLVEIVLQLVKKGEKVLVCAESNVAVDNLVEKLRKKAKIVRLGHPSRVAKELIDSSLFYQIEEDKNFQRIKRLREKIEELLKIRDQFLKPTPERKRGFSDEKILRLAETKRTKRGIKLEDIESMAEWIKIQRKISKIINQISKIEEKIARKILLESEVVLCTNSTAGLEILKDFEFDTAIIDEATQATIPSVLIPICKTKKFILAGDHKQLPPTILSEKAKKLSETLFEKLIQRYPEKSILLNVQYRMNEILMEFPNKEFYQGKLITEEKVKNITLQDFGIKRPNFGNFWDEILDPKNVVCFLDTSKSERKFERKRKDSTSKENPFEVEIIKELLEKMLKIGIKEEWVGIITPYDDQLDLLRKSLKEKVEINTVDGFQGREKEVIIISFVRSSKEKILGFLTDLRRLNTAITRAKRKLICVGDSETLKSHPVYCRFIDFIKEKGVLVILEENL
jgi:predicted DNA helicase